MLDRYSEYLKTNELLPKTIQAYLFDVSHFLGSFSDVTILMPRDISEHVKRHPSGAKRKKRYLASISSYYSFLVDEGLLRYNPVSEVRRPRIRFSFPKFLTHFEVDVIRKSCPNLLVKTIIDTFYFTGIRREELRTCQLTSLDMEKCEIKVVGKGNRIRFVPFPRSLLPLYQEYIVFRGKINIDESSQNYLFIDPRTKKQFNETSINSITGRLSKKTGIKVTPHMLRHTFATHAIEQGMSRQSVQQVLGHRSVSTTDWYIHIEANVRGDYDKAFK